MADESPPDPSRPESGPEVVSRLGGSAAAFLVSAILAGILLGWSLHENLGPPEAGERVAEAVGADFGKPARFVSPPTKPVVAPSTAEPADVVVGRGIEGETESPQAVPALPLPPPPPDEEAELPHATEAEPAAIGGTAGLREVGPVDPGSPIPRVAPPNAPPAAAVEPVSPPPAPAAAGRNPRQPPPGTPPEVEKVFVRLPLSPADRPPVGGIGKTGIHVDRIEMGSRSVRGQCQPSTGPLSIARDGGAEVCFRVVHPRQDEELVVLWQKDGQTQRRAKVGVPSSQHGYRTRAHLVLRAENTGEWTVRIVAADGTELAHQVFAVVP